MVLKPTQVSKANEDKEQVGYFQSKDKRFIYGRDTVETLNDINNELLKRITDWISEGSGWTIKSVDKHIITIVKYKSLRGSSYLPLPTVIKNKKGLINIKNEKDNECFRWCHLVYIYPAQKDPQRFSKYKK
ncbi:hypothetical protein MAR_007047 [Mya arenaria]|uniref:Uncharacterized protein n=1 Tax=Mya arenaria TaxID=6604 RepID=A0ABY7DA86_MYAAR|nr:hypothetical protein MAR_007047 [Mya arenaria]